MRYIQQILAFFLTAALTGCAGLGLTAEEKAKLTPQQKFYQIQDQLIAAFEPAIIYAKKPVCSATVKVGCHNPAIVRALLDLKKEADLALDTAAGTIFGDFSQDETTQAVLLATAIAARVIGRVQSELVKAGVYGSKREWFYQEALTYG